MITDALVIGAGTAGLATATRLAQGGLRVLVAAAGEGSLPLAGGTIDVLGYGPGPVETPLSALPVFVEANLGHPYELLTSPEELAECLEWFRRLTGPLGYIGDLSRNHWVPTLLGGLRPAGLLPLTMAAGDLSRGGEVVIAGIRGFRDFHSPLMASNLSQATAPAGAAIEARAVELAWPGPASDLAPFRVAQRLEDPEIRRQLAAQLRPHLGRADAVGMPPILGRARTAEVHADLQQRLERRVFETPGLPPSLPGLRLFDRLRQALREAGGRLVLGSKAVAAMRDGRAIRSVTITQASRAVPVNARVFVLATGGFGTGGIVRDQHGGLSEPIFDLPVAGPADRPQPFGTEYFSDHPLELAGVSADARGRPLGVDGIPFADNLYAAGAILAGARPWREKSGEGISLATAYRAAASILRGES
ncbi:MAG TPA: anaerobic glycerol-3-phosphate dehydrogenase subunit GlpB [Candidatus Binatia bacterium]|nr:anaerobic glycerol-3-phosphate dehydrogenase subunit GlpB [Candidatus Binatia bacterium]